MSHNLLFFSLHPGFHCESLDLSKLFPSALGTHSSESSSVTKVTQKQHSWDKPPPGLSTGPLLYQQMPEKSRKKIKQQIKLALWAPVTCQELAGSGKGKCWR